MAGDSDETDSDLAEGAISEGTKAVLGEIIKASAKNPDVLAAGSELGKAAGTIAKAINVVLLPIAAINYGYDKAREYFSHTFQRDLEVKLTDVPAEELVEPKASLAAPIIQGLTFSHDEPNLREMYLNLLASSMDRRKAGAAHPAFAEIIKQLAAEEAGALCSALCPPATKEIVQVVLKMPGPNSGWRSLLNHLMHATDGMTGAPVEDPRHPAMVDNWIRLGLVEVTYAEFLESGGGMPRYSWVNQRPEFQRLEASFQKAPAPTGGKIEFRKGIFRTTAFGAAFDSSVNLAKIRTDLFAGIQSAGRQADSKTTI